MIPAAHRQEQLSLAYLRAIAAQAGCVVTEKAGSLDYGTDLIFAQAKLVGGDIIETGFALSAQAKSTTGATLGPTHLTYAMKSRAYNRLVKRIADGGIPHVLLLYCMPHSQADWFTTSEDHGVLKRCAYWWTPPNTQTTSNTESITITIPRSQIFDGSTLSTFLTSIRQTGTI